MDYDISLEYQKQWSCMAHNIAVIDQVKFVIKTFKLIPKCQVHECITPKAKVCFSSFSLLIETLNILKDYGLTFPFA